MHKLTYVLRNCSVTLQILEGASALESRSEESGRQVEPPASAAESEFPVPHWDGSQDPFADVWGDQREED